MKKEKKKHKFFFFYTTEKDVTAPPLCLSSVEIDITRKEGFACRGNVWNSSR